MVTRKAASEEDRAASGRVTSPKELTAIQEEVAALKRRQSCSRTTCWSGWSSARPSRASWPS